ncbi:EAL domain-containing protein (putative c-di-GMP-specific phosphodiesterase class I) [Amorphus suaedae]
MVSTIACDFTIAFQPVVNLADKSTMAYEALVRGPKGEPGETVLLNVSPHSRCEFDKVCRRAAFRLAEKLQLCETGTKLTVNFLPSCIDQTSDWSPAAQFASETGSLALDRIIFECRDSKWLDTGSAIRAFREYRSSGFLTSLDNFGPTAPSLELLSQFQPDFVKLSVSVVRGVDSDVTKQKVAAHALRYLRDLNIQPIGVGVETLGELEILRDLGLQLFQGYLFARPAPGCLVAPNFPS